MDFRVNTNGTMADLTLESGLNKSSKAWEYTNGRMANSIRESIGMIRNMGMESTLSKTGEPMKDGGTKESNMD
jgi:hypothetical protein